MCRAVRHPEQVDEVRDRSLRLAGRSPRRLGLRSLGAPALKASVVARQHYRGRLFCGPTHLLAASENRGGAGYDRRTQFLIGGFARAFTSSEMSVVEFKRECPAPVKEKFTL